MQQRRRSPTRSSRRADELQLVDLTPRRSGNRLARGRRLPGRSASTPRSANYFRPGQPLARCASSRSLWLADRVDEGLAQHRERTRSTEPWETRERVLVALTGSRDGERLVRRAARMAQRMNGELVAVHVHSAGRASRRRSAALLERQRELVERARRRRTTRSSAPTSGERSLDAARARSTRRRSCMGSEPPLALAAADARLGDRQSDPRVRRRDRRPRRSATRAGDPLTTCASCWTHRRPARFPRGAALWRLGSRVGCRS